MEALLITCAVAIGLIALLLTGIILIQQSKGGGFGVAFGGLGETVFGAHAASHLVRVTVTLMVIFFVLVLVMNMLASHGSSNAIENAFAQTATTDSAVMVSTDSPVNK